MKLMLIGWVVLLLVSGFAVAQDDAVAVEITAADGQTLVGDYYAPTVATDGDPVAVLLLHQYNSTRRSWNVLIPDLLAEGYAVYAVDLRGHGGSGSRRDWSAAQADTQQWIDWILAQPGTADDRIILIGASIGSSLALVGCAAHPACVTAVALSPGLDYFNVLTEPALEGLADRSALLIAMQRDRESADATRALVMSAAGELNARLYSGSTHGTAMFGSFDDGQLQAVIVDWLRWHRTSD